MRPKFRRGDYDYDGAKTLLPEERASAAAVQSGCYALEALSCTYGTRLSCFAVTIIDDKIYLWHYNACGIVYSDQVLSFVDDFEDAVVVILAMVNANPERFGALPNSVMAPPKPYPYATKFPPSTLLQNRFELRGAKRGDKYVVVLRKPLNAQYTITGRRSFVYTARITPSPKGYGKTGIIVKFSYQVATRTAESALVSHAKSCGVEHLPDIHGSEDLMTLKDNAQEVYRRRKKYMKRLGISISDEKPFCEDRILRGIVYTEYLSLRDLFGEHVELLPIMVDQMLDCKC